MFKRILVPVDGSEQALRALRLGATLANEQGADLDVLNVVNTPSAWGTGPLSREEWEAYAKESGGQVLGAAAEVLKDMGITKYKAIIEMGNPAEVILMAQKTKENLDLVVMGKKGTGEFKGMLVGSVADKVTHNLVIPVMLVP